VPKSWKPDLALQDTVVELSIDSPSVLACGAWLKNTVCVTRGNMAHISQLIGDLGTPDACMMLEQTVERLCAEIDVLPEIVAHDLHPDFFSTRFALNFAAQHDLPVIAVQHHHAHIAALCAEHHITEPVMGLALDGVGLGLDGKAWGGELLRVDGAIFERIGHLAPLAMPGGDRAAQEPWRMAGSVLFRLGRADDIAARFPNQAGAKAISAMLQRGLNCPSTSSMGRLFDAAAGLLGVSEVQEFEAQAAITLQQMSEEYGAVDPLDSGFDISGDGVLDFSPLLMMLTDCNDASFGAAIFHSTLVDGLAAWVKLASDHYSIKRIALGGGCFHNDILLHSLSGKLIEHGIRVLKAKQMPPNDSAISLGQAWVAAQSIM